MADKPTYEGLKEKIKELNKIVDECKLTEEALKENEERYRTLHENVPVGLYRASSSGKLLSANPAAVKMFGFDPKEDLSSFHFMDLYKETDKGKSVSNQLKTEGQITEIEAEFKRKDGSLFWGSVSATLVTDKDGKFIFSDGIIQDITERKHAEENLLQEKAFTEAILSSLPGSFYVTDDKLRLIRWNENFEILSGYSAEELFHKLPIDFFEGEDLIKVSQSIEQVFINGKATVEADVRLKDGTKTPYFITGSLLTQNNKNYILGVSFDITDHKQMEEALRNSERRLADIINFLPDATFVIDTEGKVIAWNRAIEELSGVKAENILGKGDYEYAIPFYGIRRPVLIDLALHWDDKIAKKYAYLKKKGEMLVSETINPSFRPEPSLFWNSARVLYNTHGDIIGAIEVIRDITDRMLAEDKLRKSEQQYRSLFENTGTATFVAEEDMTISQINAKCEELIGYSRDEIEGHLKTSDFVGDEDLEKIKRYHVGRREGNGDYPSEYELELVDKLGETKNAIIQVGMITGTKKSIASIIDITPLRRTQEALRESEERYRLLVETMSDSLVVIDANGLVTYSNKRAGEMLGRSRNDVLGRPLTYFLDKTNQLIFNQELEKRKQGEHGSYELTFTHKDGKKIPTIVSPKPILDADGRFAGSFAVITEITVLKRAEQSLRESERRFRALFESANSAILIIKDDTVMDINEKTLETFGCTREQIIGQPLYELSPLHQPDGRNSKEKALEIFAKVLNGEPQIFEWRHTRFNGKAFDAEVSLSSFEIESKKFIQAIVRDITEKKSLDKQVRLMQHWVEQSVDLFFWVGEDSQILYVNQAVCHFLGYTKEEFRTMKVSDFDLGLPLEAWPDFTQRLREQGSLCFETRLRKKNGQIFPVEIIANILNFEGKAHFFAYGRDISAKVVAEKKRKELEDQLRQAQKMEAIGTLAGGIAHDFNNILSAIIGFTEISIRDVSPGSKLENNLQRVLNAGTRAGDLVKQILTFSRQTDREMKPLQVKPIAKEALKLIRASLPATIEIHQDISSDSPTMADPTQVHQIIMNLCTNAAHAMQDSGGRMVVSLTDVKLSAEDAVLYPDLTPGPFLKLTVSDSGHGIAPEIKDRIFDPFYTTKELGEGTGLGLSVVHGIVMECGGMISIESTPGKGSTFNVFFPVIDKSRHVAEIATRAPLPTGTERILFVDDEEDQVEMGKQVLEHLGYSVTAKVSSQEALMVFRAKPNTFDLVITDLTMPQLTGDVLAKEIMTIRSDVPVILCTGYSDKITPAKAKALGIKEVVMKPAVVEEIARTVRMVLDQTIKD